MFDGQEENIYNAEKTSDVYMEKPTFYKSKFQEQIRMEYKAVKDRHRTMGYAEVPLNPPNEFLKKDQGIRKPRPNVSHTHNKSNQSEPKDDENDAQSQTANEIPKRGTSGGPRKIVPRYVDRRFGDLFDVEKSGLMPLYVHSSNFGKLPKYLAKRSKQVLEQKEEMQDEDVDQNSSHELPEHMVNKSVKNGSIGQTQPLMQGMQGIMGMQGRQGKQSKQGKQGKQSTQSLNGSMQEESREKPACRYISPGERDDLMKGLKHNWAKLQCAYQALPILTDTMAKIVRKSKLENDLKAIEKDIIFLETHPYIYVYDDESGPTQPCL